jgi:hypothetical protein
MSEKVAVYVSDEEGEMTLKRIPPKTWVDKAFEFVTWAIIFAFVFSCGGIVGFFIGAMQ